MRAIRDEGRLSSTAKLCALVLATYFNRRGECFPSRATIGRGMGKSVWTVSRALSELAGVGAIEIERHHNTSSVYRRVDPDWIQF